MRFVNFLVAVVFALVLCVSFGCEPSQAKSEPVAVAAEKKLAPVEVDVTTAAGGSLQFEKVEHDFGDVIPGSYNNCSFKFKNVGDGVLKIGKTKGTCKCTVPDLKKKEYAPGESGELKVRFHAPKYNGNTSQHIFVFSDDAIKPKIEIAIKANVKTFVKAVPERMELSLIKANAGAGAIEISSIDGEAFAITKIESGNMNAITFDFDPATIATKHVLVPKVDIEKLKKQLSGAFVFTVNHPKTKSIRVVYSCKKEFEASPASIILRSAKPGEVQKRTVYLISNYDQPIEVESASSKNGIAKVVAQRKTENRFEFDVEITPPSKDGKKRYFSDAITIKLKDKEPITINCRGFYKFGRVDK